MSPSQPEPGEAEECYTEALNTETVVCDGPGDRTVRPRPPNVPRFWPEGVPLPKPPFRREPPVAPESEQK